MFMALDERGEANSKSQQAATSHSHNESVSHIQSATFLAELADATDDVAAHSNDIPNHIRNTLHHVTLIPVHSPFRHFLHAVAFSGGGHCGVRSVCSSSAQAQDPSCSLGHGQTLQFSAFCV